MREVEGYDATLVLRIDPDGRNQPVSGLKANAATWLVLKPMDIKEAKKNAPNVRMDPEALTGLKGHGDGYFRDRGSPRARRVQVQPLSTKNE